LTDDEILRQHKVTVNIAEETDNAIFNQLREEYFLMSMCLKVGINYMKILGE
jgi:hypothetical protein